MSSALEMNWPLTVFSTSCITVWTIDSRFSAGSPGMSSTPGWNRHRASRSSAAVGPMGCGCRRPWSGDGRQRVDDAQRHRLVGRAREGLLDPRLKHLGDAHHFLMLGSARKTELALMVFQKLS